MNIAAYGFAIWETFYVTVLSTAFALVLGLPLGVLLVVGERDGVLPLPRWLMSVLNVPPRDGGEHRGQRHFRQHAEALGGDLRQYAARRPRGAV